MPAALRRPDPEDTFRWADGTEAFRHEVEAGDFDWMSDDYEVIPFEDAEAEE